MVILFNGLSFITVLNYFGPPIFPEWVMGKRQLKSAMSASVAVDPGLPPDVRPT